MRTRLLIAAAGVCAAAFFAVAVALAVRQADTNRIARLTVRDCQAIEHLKAYSYLAAGRGLKALPTIAYYRQHPDELALAVAELHRQQKFFAPKECP